MIVDVHNHYYPPAYLEAIRTGGSAFRVTEDESGNPVLHSPGDYNVVVPGHRDLEYRTRVLDEAGVDVQMLTFTAPATSIETPERAVELSRIVNDAFAADVERWGGRYTALATLPMNAPDAAAEEATRAMEELGLPGVTLLSNASGVPLSDDRFRPVFEALDRSGAVVFIHPTYPVGVEVMEKYMLMPMVGFLMDTTLAAASLVYAGVVERHPRITWILAHLGGAVPYMAERFDRGFEAYPECRERCTIPPSVQLRAFYYDTVNFDPACLRLAIDFAGADHILAGSDYPHMIGSLSKMKSSLAALGLPEDDLRAVRGGNAARVLGLDT
ncbi:MAG TPA: amidohydrolase family protein [Longimicrobiales bacterium]|nr:amidohydrolase family protein [Longimicrobiales bacterium]